MKNEPVEKLDFSLVFEALEDLRGQSENCEIFKICETNDEIANLREALQNNDDQDNLITFTRT